MDLSELETARNNLIKELEGLLGISLSSVNEQAIGLIEENITSLKTHLSERTIQEGMESANLCGLIF